MPNIPLSQEDAYPFRVNRVPSLALNDVVRLATTCPAILADAAEYARRFYPRAGLGRMA